MTPRISQIAITLILLDEYDALQQAEPVVFQGDPNGTAIDKAAEFLATLPAQLAAPADTTPPAEPGDLDTLTKAKLRDLCQQNGLKLSGSRNELLARIKDHQTAAAAAA